MKLPEYPQPSDQGALDDVQRGDYERHYTFKEGDVVLDLGAHVGFFSEWVLPKIGNTGKVFAFEPHPRNFREATLRLSGFPNCTLVNAAASDSDGTIDLWHASNNSGGHSVIKDFGIGYDFAIPVIRIPIGEYCNTHQIVPNFVKIDTEGSEAVILQSLLSAGIRPDAFAMECHSDAFKSSCMAMLREKHYTLHDKDWMVYANK